VGFYEHTKEFAGKPVEDFQRGQPLKDPENTACRLRVGYDDEHTIVDLFTELLEDPGAERLSGLVIGAWASPEDMYDARPTAILNAMVAAASRLPNLTSFFLGDIISEENEVSWIQQADVSPLWTAFPRLTHVAFRGSEGLKLGRLEHVHLKLLVIQCGGLPKSVLAEIAAARLPALEGMCLFLGTDNYGFDGSIEDVKPLLQKGLFPKLEYLGLCDSEIADDVAVAVTQSPLLTQLKFLDLSLGMLGEVGARALLECEAIRGLEELDLSHHYIPDDLMKQLKALPITVDVSEQQDLGEDDDYRYVAVGE